MPRISSGLFSIGLVVSCSVAITGTALFAGAAQVPQPQRVQPRPGGHPSGVSGPTEPSGQTESQSETAVQKQLVRVVLATSRPEVTRNDEAFGVTADVTNVANEPVTLYAREVQLTIQPEATKSQEAVALTSFLPNTACSGAGSKPQCDPSTETGSDTKITLQPGEHYVFFWNDKNSVDIQECKLCWAKLRQSLNFTPGLYSFVVTGKLHLNDSDGYHTFAEAIPLKISLSQLAILIWAGLGALLAYLLVNFDPSGDIGILWTTAGKPNVRSGFKIIRGLISAFLTGSILSIIANRLSDTQFPVKVSVNDVWGSITVGFVFFFVGNKLLDKLKSTVISSGSGVTSPSVLAHPAPIEKDDSPEGK